ncbi:MAG: hypothetical protein JJU11_01975, partial [Candidatus Sumerlaeia bacterium]|nr:hypothetical protein [Candidatus Sumerlaeia bacterium]
GFLSSGSATKIGAVMAEFTNTSNEPLDGLNIKYDVEQYRNGSNPEGFSMRLRYSLDGESWSDAPSFTTNFSPGVDNSGFANAPGSVQNVAGDLPVSIPGNGTIFLKWRYSVTSGNTTTNAIALAVDNLELYGLTPPDTTPPLVAETVPPSGSLLNTMPSVSFTFDKPVTNVAAGELEVNGSAATDVSGEGAGPYIFTGFAPPADGPTTISLADGTIEDLSGNLFDGISFPVTIDSVPPEVASISPGITGLINTFPSEISVTMTEPLDEFDPEAIVVNGSAATTISGSGAGPYIFSGYTLPEEGAGTVNFDGLRMTDAAGNAAVDVVYTFTLDTTPPVTTLVADNSHVAGPDIGFTYTVVEDNAVSGTFLLARTPGSGTFEEASAAIDPVEGTIVYTASVAGLHEFIAISEDMAGNIEAVDPANAVSVVVNPTENAPVTLEIAEGTDVEATFPMDSGIQATVTFDSVTVAGTLTIERIIGDLNAASLGLNTDRLAGQVYIITADGGLDFTTATLSFEMDEALFGMELVSIERVFINRGGTMTEVSGGDLVVAGSTVTVSGITAFSEWYFGDAATSVSDWMILMD